MSSTRESCRHAGARPAATLCKVGLAGLPGALGSTTGSGSAPGGRSHRGGLLRPRPRNCILIWLAGGASHIDTFDPKPGAPADVRGEFKPIATSVPGPPDQRGLAQPGQDHGPGHLDPQHDLARGRPRPRLAPPADRLPAHAGPRVSQLRQRGRQGARAATRGCCPLTSPSPTRPLFSSSGYLTPAYDPFAASGDPNQENFRVRNLTPPDKLTLDRLLRRRAMVKALDEFAHDVPATTADHQPRPVRRPGVLADDLERRAGRVSPGRRVAGRARQVRPDDRSASRACWRDG